MKCNLWTSDWLLFRQGAVTKLLNKHICFDVYLQKIGQFLQKNLNSMTHLISAAKQQILRLSSKFQGLLMNVCHYECCVVVFGRISYSSPLTFSKYPFPLSFTWCRTTCSMLRCPILMQLSFRYFFTS